MRKILTVIVLLINVCTGFHALINGSYFIAAACSIFGVFCFIDLKEGVI